MLKALDEWKRQNELMNENILKFEKLNSIRNEAESLFKTKSELTATIKKCFDAIKLRSIEDMSAAARKFFDDEANFTGIARILTQQDQDSLLGCIGKAFDAVFAEVDVLDGKLVKQRTEELLRQDKELEKILEFNLVNEKL